MEVIIDMSNKTINIASIFTAVLYAFIQIMGFCIPEISVTCATFVSMLFICLLALYSAIVVLPRENKKIRKIRVVCMVLAALELLLCLIFCVNIFAGFMKYYGEGIRWISMVFVTLLLLSTIGLILIDSDKSLFITKATSSICVIMFFLLGVIVCKTGTLGGAMAVSISMTGAAVSLNLLAPRFKNKTAQKITSIASLVFIIIPLVYLARGYIGFRVVVTNILVIFSVLVSLACTICIAISGIKADSSSTGTSDSSSETVEV